MFHPHLRSQLSGPHPLCVPSFHQLPATEPVESARPQRTPCKWQAATWRSPCTHTCNSASRRGRKHMGSGGARGFPPSRVRRRPGRRRDSTQEGDGKVEAATAGAAALPRRRGKARPTPRADARPDPGPAASIGCCRSGSSWAQPTAGRELKTRLAGPRGPKTRARCWHAARSRGSKTRKHSTPRTSPPASIAASHSRRSRG